MVTMKYIGERSRMNYVYTRNEKLIKSKTKEFLGIGSVVTASTYLDYVIDFVLVGGLLGANALAAAELCDSFVDIAEPPGFVISSGGSIAAGILLGKRKHAQRTVCLRFPFCWLCWAASFAAVFCRSAIFLAGC